jgi:hypothetical protein
MYTRLWKLLEILQNVIEKSVINWRVLPLVKINTHISDTPCIYFLSVERNFFLINFFFLLYI